MSPPDTTLADPTHPAAAPWRFGGIAITLHWTLALLIAATAALGWYMTAHEDDSGLRWTFDLHASVGVLIALLVLARLAWRLAHRPGALPASVPRWQSWMALGNEWLMYGLMVLIPIAGYVGSAYTEAGVTVFGLATPRWALPDHDTAESFFEIHETLVWVLVALVAAHVLGTLKHLLVDKDGVAERMGFGPQP